MPKKFKEEKEQKSRRLYLFMLSVLDGYKVEKPQTPSPALLKHFSLNQIAGAVIRR